MTEPSAGAVLFSVVSGFALGFVIILVAWIYSDAPLAPWAKLFLFVYGSIKLVGAGMELGKAAQS